MNTSNPLDVFGISRSLRRASYNTALLRAAAEQIPPGITLEFFDPAPLPLSWTQRFSQA